MGGISVASKLPGRLYIGELQDDYQADCEGICCGDDIIRVDGQKVTLENYKTLLQPLKNEEPVTMGMKKFKETRTLEDVFDCWVDERTKEKERKKKEDAGKPTWKERLKKRREEEEKKKRRKKKPTKPTKPTQRIKIDSIDVLNLVYLCQSAKKTKQKKCINIKCNNLFLCFICVSEIIVIN